MHRIGRTGRAGATGIAVTFVDWADLHRWKMINKALDLPFDEPQETYSTSEHLYHDLGIAPGTKGRIKDPEPVERAPRSDRSGGRDGGRSGGRDGGRSARSGGRGEGGRGDEARSEGSGDRPARSRNRNRSRSRSGEPVAEGATAAPAHHRRTPAASGGPHGHRDR